MWLLDWLLDLLGIGRRRRQKSSRAVREQFFPSLRVRRLEPRRLLNGVTVTNLTDDVNGDTSNIGALQADAGGDGISLREAVLATNNDAGDDTITLPAGTITLDTLGTREDAALTGDLDITDNLTITGAGQTILDANGIDRVFEVFAGVTVNLEDVMITGGNVTGSDDGGGIRNLGTLNITDSTIIGNSAGNQGGGIANIVGGTLRITNSTLDNNTATNGGGLWNNGTATLTNSTVSGNSVTNDGGGISNFGTVNLRNSTLTDNSATNDAGGFDNSDDEVNSVLNFSNTIIAGNMAPTAPDGRGAVTVISIVNSQGNNLIGNNNGFVFAAAAGDQIGTTGNPIDPLLGPLQNNGGPTETHALLIGSPAIDAGDNTDATATDQRGLARVVDGDGDGTTTIDIGAFEFAPPDTPDTPDTVFFFDNTGGGDVTVRLNGDNLEFVKDGMVADSRLSTVIEVIITGDMTASDTLTVDYSFGGFFDTNITFNGGEDPGNMDNDMLVVTDPDGMSSTVDFASLQYNALANGSGKLVFDSTTTISFTGLEPVVAMPVAGTITIIVDPGNTFAGLVTTTFTSLGGGMNRATFTGGLEMIDFMNPTVELIVNGDSMDADTITFTSLDAGFNSALTVNGNGGGTDTVNLNTNLTLGSAVAGNTGNLSVTATTIIVAAGVELKTNDATTNGQPGNVMFTASRDIVMNAGSSITTLDGTISLSTDTANAAGTATGNFTGIDLDNATITTGGPANPGGKIMLTGRGGDTGNSNNGVLIQNGSTITSQGIGMGAASITISGTGGAGDDFNFGVLITDAMTLVRSADGAVDINGTGGNGSGFDNIGVAILSGAVVESTNSATMTIAGTGGTGTIDNSGVVIEGNNARVSSVDGAVNITGTGGAGSGTGNAGIEIVDTAVVRSTGSGPGAGTITINGTGGGGTDSDGVEISSGARVESIGINSAGITINGIGGVGEFVEGPFVIGSGNNGVLINGTGSQVTAISGGITIAGTGMGTGDKHDGVEISDGGMVLSTGNGPGVGMIDIDGTGSIGGRNDNNGVLITGVDVSGNHSQVTSIAGDISIDGRSNGSGANNNGIALTGGGNVSATGTANITFFGIENNATNPDHGILIDGAMTTVVSNNGTIDMTAADRANIAGNLQMNNGSQILSTTGEITLISTNDVQLGRVMTSNNVFVTADATVFIPPQNNLVVQQPGPGGLLINSGPHPTAASSSGPVTQIAIFVTTTADVVDPNDGVVSLREAIISANSTPGSDTINIPAGTYTLTIMGTGENAAETGDLDITDDLTIIGATGDAADVIIDAARIDRVFDVVGAMTVKFSDVTIQNGESPATEFLRPGGGGIFNEGTLTLDGVIVRDNRTEETREGGGVFNAGGPLTINDSTITGNSAGNTGGGIFNASSAGDLTIADSTIDGNEAGSSGGGIGGRSNNLTITDSSISNNTNGGGIQYSLGAGGSGIITSSIISGNLGRGGLSIDGFNFFGPSLTITDSLISDNVSQDSGGGISVNVMTTITDSTISGNQASGTGGGIHQSGVLAITGSSISGNTAGNDGGGIAAFGDVTIFDSIINSNTTNRDGGGINNDDELTLTNSTVSGNTAGGNGGGIFNDGTLNLDYVTITDNIVAEVPSDGGGIFSDGGGIFNDEGTVTLTGSTVSGNTASGNGGGINNDDELTLTNSTVSGNTAGGNGGGIFNDGTLNLDYVTITDNIVAEVSSDGGGIFNDEGRTVNFHSTIIAGNVATCGEAPDVSGVFNSQGFNLIQDTTGAIISGDLTGNITGQDPLLDSLADNGGPILTHALLTGSPAIDTADPSDFPDTDQRGVVRPQGAGSDIGAFEVQIIEEPIVVESNGLGAIVDHLAGNGPGFNNIVANQSALRAGSGIGSNNAVGTSINVLAANNSTVGNVNVENFGGGLLTVGTANGTSGVTNNAPGGQINIINNSPITIDSDIINNNGGNIDVTAMGVMTGDMTLNGSVVVAGGPGNIRLFAGDSITVGPNVVIQTATPGSTGGPGNIRLFAGGNITFEPNVVIQTATPGSIIDIDAGGSVNFGPDVVIRTAAPGSTIDIDTGGDVVGVFRNNPISNNGGLRTSSDTIRTSEGIVHLGRPFIDVLVLESAPQVSALGDVQYTVDLGVPGETNIRVIVDWGDMTLAKEGAVDNPAVRDATIYIVDAGTHTFFHNYSGNPSPNPADPIPISFTVEFVASIQIDGLFNSIRGGFDFTISDNFGPFLVTVPGVGPGERPDKRPDKRPGERPGERLRIIVFDLESGASLLSSHEPTVQIDFQDDKINRAIQEVSSVLLPASESTAAVDEQYVLRLILPNGDEKDFDLANNILEGDNTKKLWQRLPDNRYRIILIRKDGSERLVLEVKLDNHQPVDEDSGPSTNSGQQDDGQPQTKSQPVRKPENSQPISRAVDQPAMPRPKDNGEFVDGENPSEDPTVSEKQGGPTDLPQHNPHSLPVVELADSRQQTAISASTLVGTALAYSSLRRGRWQGETWEERVDRSLASCGKRPLSKAARLRRQFQR